MSVLLLKVISREASTIIQGRIPTSTVSKPPVEELVPNVLTKSAMPSKVVEIDKTLVECKSYMSDFKTNEKNL